jgi:hypothetical protein
VISQASVDALSNEASALRTELQRTNTQLRKRTRALWVAVSLLAAVLIVVVISAYRVQADFRAAIDRNNLRWCPVVEPLAPRPGDPPPAGTPEQQDRSNRIRVAFEQLTRDFGCRP